MIRDAKGWGNPRKYDIVIDIYFNVILTIMPPKTKVKEQGQVFTPKHLVNDILDAAGYTNGNILNKHVIDNSCGDGAFLTEIVRRYISEFKRKNFSLDGAKPDLEKYIHGIEKDPNIFISCIKNLNKISDELNIGQIKWDIINGDSLEIDQYDKKMDFVVGNPPYVRVHNLKEQYNSVKKYSFANNGMTDLYIVFFEIGLKMLNKNGILCYITPNSFCNSLAGTELRRYLQREKNLETLIDLGHYQAFSVTTYTIISKIFNNRKFIKCRYYKYNEKNAKAEFVTDINYEDLFIDGKIVLSRDNRPFKKYFDFVVPKNPRVQVKNGFATLNDEVFIQNDFGFNGNIIDVLKASTGQWKKCIYPYDSEGKLTPFERLDVNTQDYFNKKKHLLVKDGKKIDSLWYGFGRTQAIKDVFKDKISINTTIKDIDSIKLNLVKTGQGIYSGLYMITDTPFEVIEEKIRSISFLDYLRSLNKCKSGGYYTFSSKELAKYINSELQEDEQSKIFGNY